MAGGITFGVAAPLIAGVVDNGIDPNDPRVLIRTNEAVKIILDNMIPVNGMMTVDIAADATGTLLLPKKLKNAIMIEVRNGARVRGQTDVTQGWYDIINQFTYVDPSVAHDNPLIDEGLVPDSVTPSILRRQYAYPGLQPNAIVRVTGAKAYVPITQNSDFLIVQNLEAIKLIILSIERFENNAPDDGKKYRQEGFDLLQAEAKTFILDPRNVLQRKSAYEDDLVNYDANSFAWTRARLALEVPGAMLYGKSELTRILQQAEFRLMEKGVFRGCIKNYQADVTGGFIYFPRDVDGVLAADFDGCPIDVRSAFFPYLENGPGFFACYISSLIDMGEEYFPASKTTRRKYLLHAGLNRTNRISVIAKIRWVEKQVHEQMTIRHFEALRLMATAIVLERQEKWQEAMINSQSAVAEANSDLQSYLKGIKHTMAIQTGGFGMGDIGGML